MATDILGSKQPTFPTGGKKSDGYGQSGFAGSSSDTPGKHTTSGFLPQTVLPKAEDNGQTRPVSSAQAVPNAHGQRPLNSAARVPSKLDRK
jgi:hypothetical protein